MRFENAKSLFLKEKLIQILKVLMMKLFSGTYWLQSKYHYRYHYEYQPDAIITEENGKYILTGAGQSISVMPIESSIDGEFNGWDGYKKYRLINGQVWQQAEYKYEYTYAYCPEVMICNINGTSPEEDEQIEIAVCLSGLTKQDYIISKFI